MLIDSMKLYKVWVVDNNREVELASFFVNGYPNTKEQQRCVDELVDDVIGYYTKAKGLKKEDIEVGIDWYGKYVYDFTDEGKNKLGEYKYQFKEEGN
jgi:hypothetical protein